MYPPDRAYRSQYAISVYVHNIKAHAYRLVDEYFDTGVTRDTSSALKFN